MVDIDLAVEDLIDRLKAGKIYAPDKVGWALENFFQPEKLAVLREIALREVAESVDRTVAAKAGDGDAGRRSAASERVMVCLPTRPPPHGAMLLRQGSRLAGRLNTDWFVVHVETKSEAVIGSTRRLQRYLLDDEQRARDLGAEVVRLRSEKPVDALLEFGRDHGVRHIVVGRSHKPWWRRMLGQSPVFKLVTEAAGFDLHIVSLEDREAQGMNLFKKLLLAQAPIAIALAIVGVFSVIVVSYLGSHSQTILKDNYRSVLAAQRMKEAIERMDSGALFIVAGERQKGLGAGGKKSADLRSRAESAGRQHHRSREKRNSPKGCATRGWIIKRSLPGWKKPRAAKRQSNSTFPSWSRPFTK